MSKIEIKPFEEQIRIAGIAGELERAEEKGIEKGIEQGQNNIILPLLKKYTPEEVSEMIELPLKRILQAKDENCWKKVKIRKFTPYLILILTVFDTAL